MKFNGFIAASDGQDGSFNFSIHNTKEEALKYLDKTEEELEKGCFYKDGIIQPIQLEFEEIEGEISLKSEYITSIE